jgi:hypothetical protein
MISSHPSPKHFTMNSLTQTQLLGKVARAGGNATRRATTMAKGATKKAVQSASVWCVCESHSICAAHASSTRACALFADQIHALSREEHLARARRLG